MQGFSIVLYNDVQNVVVINTSAFYLQRSLMCVANVHAVCFLQCEVIIYGKMQTVTDYLYLFIYMSLVFMKVMSKIITLRIIAIFSLQFVQRNVPFL